MKRLLSIGLVPQSTWYDNVRSRVTQKTWKDIRYTFVKGQCQYCGYAKGKLFCHEVWRYNVMRGGRKRKYVQELTGFEAVCFLCHSVHHFGLAQVMAREGRLDMSELIEHYCRVNGCTKEDFKHDLEEALLDWTEKNRHKWTIDVSYLDSLNIVGVRAWMKTHPTDVARIKEGQRDVVQRN